jgi:hypothetical protein
MQIFDYSKHSSIRNSKKKGLPLLPVRFKDFLHAMPAAKITPWQHLPQPGTTLCTMFNCNLVLIAAREQGIKIKMREIKICSKIKIVFKEFHKNLMLLV